MSYFLELLLTLRQMSSRISFGKLLDNEDSDKIAGLPV